MLMLTAEQRRQLPALRSQEEVPIKDQIAVVKWFCPWNGWTWYATEFDGDDLLFGLVVGHYTEFGYFMLSEFGSIGRGGLGIERDLHWRPQPIGTIKECPEWAKE